jgi:hypothetical protein
MGYVNPSCINCQAETTWKTAKYPERSELQLCPECYLVSITPESEMLECMECDAKAVADKKHFDCKPCRVKKDPINLRTTRDSHNRSDSFESDGPWQDTNIRKMEEKL